MVLLLTKSLISPSLQHRLLVLAKMISIYNISLSEASLRIVLAVFAYMFIHVIYRVYFHPLCKYPPYEVVSFDVPELLVSRVKEGVSTWKLFVNLRLDALLSRTALFSSLTSPHSSHLWILIFWKRTSQAQNSQHQQTCTRPITVTTARTPSTSKSPNYMQNVGPSFVSAWTRSTSAILRTLKRSTTSEVNTPKMEGSIKLFGIGYSGFVTESNAVQYAPYFQSRCDENWSMKSLFSRIRRGAMSPMFTRKMVLDLENVVQDKAEKLSAAVM